MASVHLDRPRSLVTRIERSIRRAITRGILADIGRLRASGKQVFLVSPGPKDLEVIGANLMDPRRRTAVLDTAMRTATIELRAQLATPRVGQSAVRFGQARE
jgi:NTE family protein